MTCPILVQCPVRTLRVGLLGLALTLPAFACTTFVLEDGATILYGRNYDYYASEGRVFVNRRGLLKTAFSTNSGLQWVSRYGSLTFSQWGQEFPNGGMNEAGLVIEHMMMEGSQYPSDSRPSLTELQWIQYQLDSSASVDEVLASDQSVRIQPGSTPLHFLVADRSGRAAVIEFLGGQRVCHTNNTLPVAALTNDTYDVSLAYAGFTPPEHADHVSSLGRFVQAAASVLNFATLRPSDPVGYAFAALDNVNQPNWTRWSIVYDIGNRVVYFQTQPARAVKQIQLDALDFRTSARSLMMDINTTAPGEVSPQTVYSAADNLAVLTSVYRQTTPLAYVSASYIQSRAAYPDTVRAIQPPSIRVQPVSQTLAPGGDVTLSVSAAGEGALVYQWLKDGAVVDGATNAALALPRATAMQAGDYSVLVANPAGVVTSRLGRLIVATPDPGRLCNLSVRARVEAAQPLIVGFFVQGGAKSLLVRAVGPTLGSVFNVPGALADTSLEVHETVGGNDHIVALNDDWGAIPAECNTLARVASSVGAFPLSASSRDAALLVDVSDSRTALTRGPASSGPGVALVELYDAGVGNSPRLINLSVRNQVGVSDDILIAGFTINGNVPKRLLVRGVGPTLATQFAVSDALVDPQLELHTKINDQDTVVATNDNWGDEPGVADAAAGVGAFPLPAGSKDAALLMTLPAGAYTVLLRGAGGTTGNGLIEVYEL